MEGEMSQEQIKMNYPLMEQMEKEFQKGRSQLQHTAGELNKIAEKLEQGALLGQAGGAFSQAVRGPLMNAVNKIADKFEELENDLKFAANEMRQAEETAKKELLS
jgi:WXG100 family type VII secretion target